MKLTSDQKQLLLAFIGEHWEKFVAHVGDSTGTDGIDADSTANDLHDALEEEVNQ
ncbi:MAG: hypothetical protein ACRCUF_08885 [Aeromonas sobria]